MRDADPKLSELRTAVGKAIQDFVLYQAEVIREHKDPIIAGWAVMVEYTNMEMYHEDSSAAMVVVPDDQSASTTRGLFEFGCEAFSR